MQHTFKVQNIKCNGCATTVRSKLKEEFSEVSVNLDVMPREITLEIEDSQIDNLKAKMKSLGYPFVDDELSGLEKIKTKAKSFVSCAIGRMSDDS